jgi:hypothetical protein
MEPSTAHHEEQDVFLDALRSAIAQKRARLERINSLAADGALSEQEAQDERDRAETTFTQAKKAAEAARDHSSKTSVQEPSKRHLIQDSDDEIEFLGVTVSKPSIPQPRTQLSLTGGKTAEVPALLSVDLKAKQSVLVKKGLERANKERAEVKASSSRLASFVIRAHTAKELEHAMHAGGSQMRAARRRSVVIYSASHYKELSQFQNFYHVLGINMDASCDDIITAYKSLVFRYHPGDILHPHCLAITILQVHAY